MAKDVIMPVLGMNQDTAVLLAWLKQEGERVEQGEPIMEVETDKATMELDAPASGTLARVTAAAGEDVPVGSVIAVILADDELAAGAGAAAAPPPAGGGRTPDTARTAPTHDGEAPAPSAPPAPPVAAAAPAAVAVPATLPPAPDGRVLASPKARRLAGEHGVALAFLSGRGSGPDGAVLAADVLQAAASGTVPVPGRAATPGSTTLGWATFERTFDAAPLLAALAAAKRVLGKTRADVPEPTIGDVIALFLAAVWRHDPLTAGPIGLRHQGVVEGELSEGWVGDLAATGLPGIAAARAAPVPAGAGTVLALLDLSRSRVDATGELPAASDGALLQVVVGRLEGAAPDGEASARLSLRLAFDPRRVALGAAAAWADRLLALAEEPAALTLLY